MQDTPCEPGTSPAPAPAPTHTAAITLDMATNSLKMSSPKQHVKADEEISPSFNNVDNDAKEDNETKDYSIKEDTDNKSVKDNQPNMQTLVQKNSSHVEGESQELEINDSKESVEDKEDIQYTCPVCDTVLFSSHDFTIHIRSHNNILGEDLSCIESGKEFVCRVCGKILSSASSLDRHVLVHSGERPFKCKICGFSFTTNGNMHRHMRTHTNIENGDSFNYDSDASCDSLSSNNPLSSPPLLNTKKRRVSRTTSEFNNNVIQLSPPSNENLGLKRKSDSDLVNPVRKKPKKAITEKFECSFCEKKDFLSSNLLETHIEECHPQYKAKCDRCNLVFKNYRALNLHRYMKHHAKTKVHRLGNTKPETIGFKDLTFVDFSSEKFPHIARIMCEQSLHHASSLYHRFQCEKCGRAFPCESALNIHRQGCSNESYASSEESCQQDNELSSSDNDTPTDLSSTGKRMRSEQKVTERSEDIEGERKRYKFFAGLDLQNKSMTNSPNRYFPPAIERSRKDHYFNNNNNEGKDLADIPSIISIASVGGLLHDLSKSPQPTVLEVTPPDSGSRIGIYDSAVPDEEQQDCFAAEFRKMKLRGEFPCRLCNAIFPNLRALKGHNRVHLSSNGGQNSVPYRCNMCPHFSSDKSALIRHMRTHNGDRPYECALCHYAFTTKANCERHLRNRHAKMTREDVKKSIIYHPSEDPTNEIEHKPSREDVKRSLFCEKETLKQVENKETFKNEKLQHFVKNIVEKNPNVFESIHLQKPSAFTQVQKITYVQESGSNENVHRKCLDVGTMTYEDNEVEQTMLPSVNSSIRMEVERDVPLDLSMDVLDLSKKRKRKDDFCKEEGSNESDLEACPQDLSKKSTLTIEKSSYPLCIETNERAKTSIGLPLNCSEDLKVSTPSPRHSFDGDNPVSSNPTFVPKLDLSKFYPTNAHPFYLNNASTFSPFNSASHLPPGSFPPYFIPLPPSVLFPTNPNHDLVEMKERLQKELIRGLQLTSGGTLVLDQIAMANAADRIAHHQQALAEYSWRMENCKEERNDYSPSLNKETKQPVPTDNETDIRVQEINQPKPPEKLVSKPKHDTSASVKMVIKNGVLIPKQKQRRYRTERPFSCEHCSARFTLRSNMERHIKQQHPQFWTQRQRNAASMPTRRNHSLSSKLPQTLLNHGQFYPHGGVPGYNLKSEDEVSRSSASNDHANIENKINLATDDKPCISEEVKNAIAQQLKSKFPQTEKGNDDHNYDNLMDEEDEDLVIDEEVKEEEINQEANDKKLEEEIALRKKISTKEENGMDLASVSQLISNVSTQKVLNHYFLPDEDQPVGEGSEEDEEGLVAPGSASEGCNSGSDENRSEPEMNSGTNATVEKKKSAYSLAPNRVSCKFCSRKFPWSSSLRRHILTHTGQKPYKCSVCLLLFTTKSNCDRHLLRKHGGGTPTTSAETQPAVNNDPTNTPNYTMRNVPERPYKCKNCPSSTFSTLSNLKKHLSTKHNAPGPSKNDGTQCGYESQGSVNDEIDVGENEPCKNQQEFENKEKRIVTDLREIHPGHASENGHIFKSNHVPVEQNYVATQPSDLPFKCHLCEGSFAERQDALDHIRDTHSAEFQLLVSKGALEVSAYADDNQGPEEGGEESLEQLRGKFPDYANRKVMCAFCLRRFWSAEDLRRHMRTHTGERPFSCDICRRRFTLKHSMLRHRKKHSFPHNSVTEETCPVSDEDVHATNSSTTNHNNNTIPSTKPWMKPRSEEESDLISNLLGIQDKTIVDKMLISKSADDAAKLLGVQKQ